VAVITFLFAFLRLFFVVWVIVTLVDIKRDVRHVRRQLEQRP
jgi:hypothetical protein